MDALISLLRVAAFFSPLLFQCDSAGRPQHHPLSPIFATFPGGITKVFHQSWKSHKLLPHHAEWSETWKDKHPRWLYKLWTDSDNHRLIQESMPWLLHTYESMPAEIYRADLARYVYMYTYGGVYVDLDFECIKPFDELLHNKSIALAFDIRKDNAGADIGNAFLASAPGHPFWIHLLIRIVEAADSPNIVRDAVHVTGPVAINAAFPTFAKLNTLPIYVAPTGIIYPTPDADAQQDPCRFLGAAFNAATCKARHPAALAVTYWTGSWYTSGRHM